ncbi:MAG: MG2 domain-containing protein [Bacteroidales bacterium]|nr:MG2 domain-containing protein [Bacteroidales bacterium]
MKSVKIIYWTAGIALAATITIVVISMFNQAKDFKVSNPELFKDYIKAYTSNVISKNDLIAVQFTDEFMKSVKDKKTSVIKIYPKTAGKIEWKENNILEFKPDKPFTSGTEYFVVVDLDKISNNVNKDNQEFIFRVHTKHQIINLNIEKLVSTDRKEFKTQDLSVKITLNDSENEVLLVKCFKTEIEEKSVDFKIEKANDTEYLLNINNIERTNHKQTLTINYDGTEIGSKSSGKLEFEIPPYSEFKLLDLQVHQFPEQCVQLIFSDPIKEDQLLNGIIDISDVENLKYIVVDNNVKIIPSERLENTYILRINSGLKNINEKRLDKTEVHEINFKMYKPSLNADEDGVILPGHTEGQVISFQAVNIKAVDVRVLKIYENNVLQFLQENQLNGSYELNRVAKVIKTKTISLEQTDIENFSIWNTFYLNLSDIISPDPGAIYRIEIGFRKENAIYPCNNDDDEIATINNSMDKLIADNEWSWFTNYTYSDSYEDYYSDSYYYDDYYYEDDYYYDSGNSYNSYEDPCNKNYYGYRRAISFNILSSDIGMIAKIGKDNLVYAFVTDLKTTGYLKGAKVDVYNYQQQIIGSASTDFEGKAVIELNKIDKPYFIVATYNQHKSYLKIEEYGSLSTSEFEVNGSYMQDGSRAFIYTERGVWRPGDSIYVGFILNELIDPVPVGHPIVLEVRNPKNQEVYREVQNKNEKGFHVFKFKTDLNDPTGYYNASFTVGGKVFNKSLMVETIRPNRLSVSLDLDKDYLSGDGTVNAIITARWLHGAVAADLETDVTMTLEQTYAPFKDYENYSFYNQVSSFDFNTLTLFTGKTNENGEVKTNVKFDKLNKAPGVLKAFLITKVYEKGGNFSTNEKTVLYYPYKTFVGIAMADRNKYSYSYPIDKDLNIDIITLDRNQKLTTDNRELEISIYMLEYSWWYDYQYDGADYISANYNNAISRNIIDCKNGKAKSNISFDESGDYLIVVKDLKDGHTSSIKIYASNYANASADEHNNAIDLLRFNTDKESYNLGESVKISIPTGSGKALVSIENGASVIKTFWQETDGSKLDFSFEATEDMAPNIYVNISFIQEHGKTKNDRPIRMYGIIPVFVENPASHINPVIMMADELLAESKVQIQVRESSGKAMTYTIAMVDEGLLNLTGFKTPDPWSFFYSKQALGVRTWDLYKWVIGAFKIDAGKMISIGGGSGEMSPEELAQAIRFKPMVKFIGPFTLSAGGVHKHEIQLPQYIGSVRTMIVAAEGNSYGSAEKTTPVKKPLMVLGSGPRKLGTNESFKLPITVFAMKNDVKNVSITVKTNDILSLDGTNNKTINFNKEGEKYIDFDIKSGIKTGVGTIEITAKSGNYISKYDIEMDVKHANIMATDVIDGVSSNNIYETNFDVNGIAGTNSVFLELYNIPPMNLESKLDFLLSYPHGCLEQIVSAAFPQLYLENMIELDNSEKAKIQNNINVCLNKLSRYQMSNGGFAYWPGGNNVSYWATNYCGHFMIEVEKAGYSIPGNLKTNWLKYQKEKASKWTNDGTSSQLTQSYRLYTLAIAGNADMSAMNRLKESKLTRTAVWRLASAYAVSGKESIAKQMIANLSTDVPLYFELSGTFGSSTRDKAMILETLIELGEKEKAFLVLKEISEVMGSERYTSTQTTAYALMAASKFVKKYSTSGNISCTYTINGKQATANTAKPVFKAELAFTEGQTNAFSLKSENDAMIFVRIVRKGIPETGSETAASSNINMDVKYTYLNGNPINVSTIPQGTDFVATVTLKNTSGINNLENLALSQIFPSGWEIINSRMLTLDLGQDSYYTYQDIRDDRVLTYLDMNRNHTYTYRVLLNASFEGKYYLPSVMCETMYDDSNYARTKGMWVNVRK